VRVPEECVGRSWAIFEPPRTILGVDVDGAFQVIRAQAPAKEL